MPHESTVDPEEPMDFKSWGDETSESIPFDRRRSTQAPATSSTPRLNHSMAIQTHPDLPLHVTHDHDDDGDEEDISVVDPDVDMNLRSRISYTPPKRKAEQLPNGAATSSSENQ